MKPDSRSDTVPREPTVSRRRLLGTAVAGTLAGVVGCLGESRTGNATPVTQQDSVVPSGPAVGLETVATGFDQPTDFAVPPGDDRRFVVDRSGQVYVVDENGKRDQPFVDISDRMAEAEGEQGLLGLAFHPEFGDNGRFYLRYSGPSTDETPSPYSHNEVLAAFETTADGANADPDSERQLLVVPEPQSNHNGGAVTFGPDGYLYTSFGDGGKANDAGTGHVEDWYDANEGGNGQDVTENFLGSILRIDVDSRTGDKPYGIPEDNPLVGGTGLPEHYAWGFRNPWRIGFSDGDLYAADVGQAEYEEVDRVQKGGNYGWNVREGTHCFDPSGDTNGSSCPSSTPDSVRGGEPLLDPVIEYPHTRDGQPLGVSVIGGYVYEGAAAALDGQYVFGEYNYGTVGAGALFAAEPTEDGLWSFTKLDISTTDDGELDGSLSAVGRDNDDELYAVTTSGVQKIVPAEGSSGANASTTDGTRTETPAGSNTSTDAETATEAATETGNGTTAGAPTTGTAGGTAAGGGATSTSGTATGESGSTAGGSAGGAGTASGTNGGGTSGSGAGGESTSSNGPGFGVVAALAGVAAVGARVLGGRD